ncbi:MAG: hypothetical protein C0596_06485 [Marinilabiliales bacterium]|nr:MAG: hypothetical protein C0596_06485 [Marinilabiliales bacterium]
MKNQEIKFNAPTDSDRKQSIDSIGSSDNSVGTCIGVCAGNVCVKPSCVCTTACFCPGNVCTCYIPQKEVESSDIIIKINE